MSLRIVVQIDRSDDQRALDSATRMLSADLRSRGIGTEPETSDAPEGSKGTATDVGLLVVTSLLSAEAISALALVLVARVRARTAKKIIIQDGDRSVEISSDTSADETRLALETFQAARKPAGGAGA